MSLASSLEPASEHEHGHPLADGLGAGAGIDLTERGARSSFEQAIARAADIGNTTNGPLGGERADERV